MHPCLKCGACCAFYRVSFHWSETLQESFNVPIEKAAAITPHIMSMNGTNISQPKCESLLGDVGKSVRCVIYENRPSPCRNFSASYENGERNVRCDQARLSKGLHPLSLRDWPGTNRPDRPRRPA